VTTGLPATEPLNYKAVALLIIARVIRPGFIPDFSFIWAFLDTSLLN